MVKNMKRIINIGAVCLTMAVAAVMSSCSDEFIQDKKNYSNTSSEIYNYYTGANGRLNECYRITLPNIQAGGGQIWQYNSLGMKDNHSQSTEEYRDFSTFVNPQVDLNTVSGTSGAPGYFGSSWGRIREINETIEGILGGSLSDNDKNELLGQAYFLRAWCYYMLFRYYGSVPLVTNVQSPVPESFTPRSNAQECYDFLIGELNKAADMLKKRTVESSWSANDWGRVTTGTCLALKHRIMVLWASPLFNRDNDASRWTNAYNTIKAELPIIDACGYGLANENDPGVNGSGWAKMFLGIVNNPEAVFVSCYNKYTPDLTPDYQRNNLWEQQIRPANTLGNNGKTPADMIVDLFPMKDGKRPSTYDSYTKLEASAIAYDAEHPFMNRDPRFYRTFAFPGEYWRFNGDPNTSTSANPYKGSEYILWNYVWYNDPANFDNPLNSDHFGADNLLTGVHGMYIRKFSDDLDVNSVPNYNFNTAGKNVGFRECMTSTMEIRYAEVLLNLAEAACGANHMEEAANMLKRIRARAGYTSENNYGLPANIFFGTGIPTLVMVLKQHRDRDDVLIIDASKGFVKDGKQNKLRASDIKRVELVNEAGDYASVVREPRFMESIIGQRQTQEGHDLYAILVDAGYSPVQAKAVCSFQMSGCFSAVRSIAPGEGEWDDVRPVIDRFILGGIAACLAAKR